MLAKQAINPKPKTEPAQRDSSAGFCYADGLSPYEFDLDVFRSAGLALSDSEKHRLVEGSKSQTRKKYGSEQLIQAKKNAFFAVRPVALEPTPLAIASSGPFSMIGANVVADQRELAETQKAVNGAGTCTVVEYRDFCKEFRIRCQVTPEMKLRPPENSGPRESEMLTTRGARKIAESCHYMAKQFCGYKTFATGTFSNEDRARIASGETTIQKEVTRAMDALKKMYQRGWQYTNNQGQVVSVPPMGKDFRYCWVVEVPKNEAGEDNPHIHLLMDWGVDYAHFDAWSKRIEGIWHNGYFHLEKIKDPEAAGAYMAKAAGYITKASGQTDQGKVTGNRYAISKAARAPDWVTVGVFEMGIMGRLIRETYDHIQHKHAAKFEQRKKLNRIKDSYTDQLKNLTKGEIDAGKARAIRNKKRSVANQLLKVRLEINAVPIRASKYQLVIKDHHTFYDFIGRACRVGWGDDAPPCTNWIYQRKRLRQSAWTNDQLLAFEQQTESNYNDSISSYYQWADSEYSAEPEPFPPGLLCDLPETQKEGLRL